MRAAAFLKAKLTEREDLLEWLDTRFATLYDTWVGKEPNQLLDAIRDLFNAGARIITTNYDDLLSRHCHAHRDNCIMIMDNMDDSGTLIYLQMNMIPSPVRGRILLTGRVTTLGNVKDAPALGFPIMSATEAENFLKKLIPPTPVSEQAAHKLVEVFKYLP